MLNPQFIPQKFALIAYATSLLGAGRLADALHILRARRLGYEAMAWRRRIPEPCQTIVDAGAHTGEITAALDLAFRPSRLLAVEANPSRICFLKERFAHQKQIEVVGVALADKSGTLPFHRHDFDAASSLLAIQPGYLSSLGFPEHFDKIQVPARRLDQIAAERGIATIDLLKLDCQGSELTILRGTGDLLKRVRYIFTEVSFDPIYEQGPLFNNVHALLRANRFSLLRLESNQPGICGITQADALYRNADIG